MIESGGYNPTLDLCIRICRTLELTLNDLFWEDATPSEREKEE
jgi:putative transcriptional regulator